MLPVKETKLCPGFYDYRATDKLLNKAAKKAIEILKKNN